MFSAQTKYLLPVLCISAACHVNPKRCKAPSVVEELVMVQQRAARATAQDDQSKPKTELVVAVCTEDLSWVDQAAQEYANVTVYDKCRGVRKADLYPFKATNLIVQRLPNIGSCDFAYLTYILDRWESLPDIVEFTGGAPSNHRYKNHGLAPLPCRPCNGKCDASRTDNVRYESPTTANRDGSGSVPSQWLKEGWLGLQMNFAVKRGYEFHDNDVKQFFHRSGYANMGDWMNYASTVSPLSQRVYEDACCARNFGGHFTARREQIVNEAYFRGRSRELYAWLRDQQHYANEEVDHFIERTWWSVFCAAHHST